MSHQKILLVCSLLVCTFITHAQKEYNPYAPIGKKAKIVTLSKGKYVETFDTDSLQRIGSIVINIRTKEVVQLLSADSIFERFSDNSSSSRWYSIDPLADNYTNYSPYNFVLNNPIKYVDPDGRAPWDDYYSKTGKFLGSDGAATTKQRIISAETFNNISTANGGTTSEAATKALQADSKELTVKIGDGSQTEGQYFQQLYAAGDGKGNIANYKEMTTTLLLDPENAILTVYTGSNKFNGPSISFTDDPNTIPGVKDGRLIVIGDAHTHQVADLGPDSQRSAYVQDRGDGATAARSGTTLFTIDSQNIDAFVPNRQAMSGRVAKDNIGSTPDLFNNKFSILRTAIEYFGGK